MNPPTDDPLAKPVASGALGSEAGAGIEHARHVAARVLGFLARRWWVLLLVTGGLLFAVRAYAASLPRTYGCTPVVIELVQEPPSSVRSYEAYEYSAATLAFVVVPTQRAVLSTSEVLDPVVQELGLADDPDYRSLGGRVTTSVRESTSLISLTVEGPVPETNAAVANAIGRVYGRMRQEERDKFLNGLVASADQQVLRRRGEVKAAEDEILAFRRDNRIVDVGAAEETVRRRLSDLFTTFKAAEAERDRTVEAEAHVVAAETDGRDLGDVVVIREGAHVRDELATLRRLEQQAQAVALKSPESDPALVLARSQRDEQKRVVAELVRARAADIRIEAANARRRAEALGKEHAATEAELTRLVGLRVEFAALKLAEDRANTALAEAIEESRGFAELKSRKSDAVRVRQWARPSSAVVSPKLSVIYAGGGLLALVLGVLVAFLFDLASTRLRDPEEIQRLAGAPFLGTVPLFKPVGATQPGRVLLEEHDGEASESYRLLAATALLHGGAGEQPKVFLVTSPQEGEGKTTAVVGLAVALARRGGRVLVVDCDLRRPTLHAVLGTAAEPGVTTLFAPGRSVWDALRRVEVSADGRDTVRFDVLTAGILPPNPADLLSGPRMQAFLRDARARYDAVVIDSAPVNPVSDACLLAPYVDGLLLVIRDRKTHRGPLRRAVARLRGVRARFRGVVVNGVARRRGAAYGYGYGSEGYGAYASHATPASGARAGSSAETPADTATGNGSAPRGASHGGRRPAEPEVSVRVVSASSADLVPRA